MQSHLYYPAVKFFPVHNVIPLFKVNQPERHLVETKRGVRAGKNKQRSIRTITTVKQDRLIKHNRGVNPNNLTPINTGHKINKPNKNTRLCVLNCRSVRNKAIKLNEFIIENKLDIFALTETWLTDSNDQTALAELVPTGYSIPSVPRNKRGGGVALIFKSSIKSTKPRLEKFKCFECLDSLVSIKQKNPRLIIIYRPPGKSAELFFNEFQTFLEDVSHSNSELVITGDFNFHYDKDNDKSSSRLKNILDTHSLYQHAKIKTHKRGHILDLVISRESETSIGKLTVQDHILSDHFPVFSDLEIEPTNFPVQSLQVRNLKNFDKNVFLSELEITQFQDIVDLDNVNIKAIQFIELLQSVLDKLYPAKTKNIRIRPISEWFNDDVLQAKRSRNKAERRWRKTKLHVHQEIYQQEKHNFTRIIKKAKQSYYSDKIHNSSNKAKEIFRVSNSLSNHNYGATILPNSDNDQQLADKFSS
ncbi:hypothetical protein SNE40_014264 [Patella caerulea]|uniref:Endonuclease/exonuclease/phosphatase domain-containing protein n=1 Tax=Patella caerulea TaxID=87958 RepID=A0AAN8PCI5_PATCE